MTATEQRLVDVDKAARFLHALDPRPDAVFFFQTADDDKARGDDNLARTRVGTLAAHLDELQSLNRRGAAVFVTISEFNGSRRVATNYKRARAVVVDLDGEPITRATALRPSPSLIVRTSPGKFHVYWPLDFETTATAAELKGMMLTAAKACGGDVKIVDVARAMRLPGFFHLKDPHHPHMVSVVIDKDERYPLADLLRLFPPDGTRSKAANSSSATEQGHTSPEHLAVALDALDPKDFRDYGAWFAMLCACHHATAGKGRDVFFTWSARDPRYAGKGNDNAQMWRGVDRRGYSGKMITTGTLVRELRLHRLCYEANLIMFGWVLGLLAGIPDPPMWLATLSALDSGRGTVADDDSSFWN